LSKPKAVLSKCFGNSEVKIAFIITRKEIM